MGSVRHSHDSEIKLARPIEQLIDAGHDANVGQPLAGSRLPIRIGCDDGGQGQARRHRDQRRVEDRSTEPVSDQRYP
jgi:hypothetical protein